MHLLQRPAFIRHVLENFIEQRDIVCAIRFIDFLQVSPLYMVTVPRVCFGRAHLVFQVLDSPRISPVFIPQREHIFAGTTSAVQEPHPGQIADTSDELNPFGKAQRGGGITSGY